MEPARPSDDTFCNDEHNPVLVRQLSEYIVQILNVVSIALILEISCHELAIHKLELLQVS